MSDSVTPWAAACKASLSSTISQNLLNISLQKDVIQKDVIQDKCKKMFSKTLYIKTVKGSQEKMKDLGKADSPQPQVAAGTFIPKTGLSGGGRKSSQQRTSSRKKQLLPPRTHGTFHGAQVWRLVSVVPPADERLELV